MRYFIKLYQKFVSPFLGKHCRFHPTCSQYAIMAIEKHGTAKGMFLILKRLLRCNPFCKSGIDLP